MRVMVTGATGFVGRALVRHLAAEGHCVVAVARKAPALEWPGDGVSVALIGDVKDRAGLSSAVRDVDAVLHLAGLTTIRSPRPALALHDSVNRQGTQALLDAMEGEANRTGRPLTLLFASSTAVYGVTGDAPVGEEHPACPVSRYGASKLAAEEAVRERSERGAIGAVTLRACNLGGATNRIGDLDRSRLIPRVLAVAAGQLPRLVINGSGGNRREYLHIEDFLAACSLALPSVRPGCYDVYNVAGGARLSVLEVVSLAERVSGRPVASAFRRGEFEPPTVLCDPRRIREAFGWQPEHSSPERILGDAWAASASDG